MFFGTPRPQLLEALPLHVLYRQERRAREGRVARLTDFRNRLMHSVRPYVRLSSALPLAPSVVSESLRSGLLPLFLPEDSLREVDAWVCWVAVSFSPN